MIESGLVTPNTTNEDGLTPVIAATAAENVRMVQELVDFGADVDAWGRFQGRERTALMVAAGEGNLTLVKLFVDVFHADDALIAPDGQLALRLAVQAGRREVVEFLPLRRGGGWRRWKTHHAIAVRRAKQAGMAIWRFGRFFVWDVPKVLLWWLPKEAFFLPLKELVVWCWTHRRELGPWCKRKLEESLGMAREAVVWVKETSIKIAKESKIYVTQVLPMACKELAKYCWSLLTVRIPAALKLSVEWIWEGIKAIGQSISSVAQRLASILHTIIVAAVSFFRHLTLKDLSNAFTDLLRAVFVEFPAKIWSWAQQFAEVSYKVVTALAGEVGQCLWWIVWAAVWIVTYVPGKLWIIISSLGGSVLSGWHEFMFWIDPKR